MQELEEAREEAARERDAMHEPKKKRRGDGPDGEGSAAGQQKEALGLTLNSKEQRAVPCY